MVVFDWASAKPKSSYIKTFHKLGHVGSLTSWDLGHEESCVREIFLPRLQNIISYRLHFLVTLTFTTCPGYQASISPHGGRIVWTQPNSKFPFRFHMCHKHKVCQHYEFEIPAPFVHSNTLDLSNLGSGGVFLNLFTSELQQWRWRTMPRGWAALWGGGRLHRNVWQRYWDTHLIVWAVFITSRGEGGEWGLLIHLVVFPPIFRCIISVTAHHVSRAQWWNLYFGWRLSAWLHLMSNK